MEIKKISLVIPAYKAEKTIVQSVQNVLSVLDKTGSDYEIIVVSDGIIDETYKRSKAIKNPKVIALKYKKNQGKGFAVRYGALRATGDVIGFLDEGRDLDPAGILILLDYMRLHNADIVIGSKLHPDSVVKYPMYRKIPSFMYRWITQFLFGFSVLDTQVGLKIFKRKVVRDVFPRLLVKQFAFDVEILALSSVLGYRKIQEAPIKLDFRPGSISVKKLLGISFKMFIDTLAIFYRIRILQYYRKSNRRNWLKID